ncbi:hypothetical protein BLOT_005955 [Blomia tropicalis]|nr:hypothetical protein BLOT_005955 [Blomia tropicalis]
MINYPNQIIDQTNPEKEMIVDIVAFCLVNIQLNVQESRLESTILMLMLMYKSYWKSPRRGTANSNVMGTYTINLHHILVDDCEEYSDAVLFVV